MLIDYPHAPLNGVEKAKKKIRRGTAIVGPAAYNDGDCALLPPPLL
jgi:hypothetical protein